MSPGFPAGLPQTAPRGFSLGRGYRAGDPVTVVDTPGESTGSRCRGRRSGAPIPIPAPIRRSRSDPAPFPRRSDPAIPIPRSVPIRSGDHRSRHRVIVFVWHVAIRADPCLQSRHLLLKGFTMVPLLTTALLETDRAERVRSFETGYSDGIAGEQDTITGETITRHRVAVGFKPRVSDILTPPDANAKLDKGATPTYGLTLAHATLTAWNACPWSGVCATNVCVLNNGKGRYSSVRNAWRWRTTFLAEDTATALYRIGFELGRAVRKHGAILFRPNVNSDVLWHRVIPTLGDLENVTTYGYTKNPAIMVGDGRIGGIRYAYSMNENSNADRVREFVTNGGAVAVVTNRMPHAPINPDRVRGSLWIPDSVAVVDADATDEWMLADNVIGDLSAKGRARDLIGSNAFVRCCY